ncbi:hypothetical protein B0H12DRAFT_398260 [Mycena haematopus]|nr:hypothetical protein B0H12DRAFT_398260 [Mycena haematopus]
MRVSGWLTFSSSQTIHKPPKCQPPNCWCVLRLALFLLIGFAYRPHARFPYCESLQQQTRSLLFSMLSPRDLAYSLFGGPLIVNVGPTVNGEIIRVRVQPINTISVSALVISVLLFIAFMYIYLHPLFRNRGPYPTRSSDAEQPGIPKDEEEQNSLLSWLHFRSRDRFSTAVHDSPVTKRSPRLASPPGLKQNLSSFARGSLIPHLSPTLASPPPAYASRTSSPFSSPHNGPFGRSCVPSPLSSEAASSPRALSLSPPLPALSAPAACARAMAFEETLHIQFDLHRSAPSHPQTTHRSRSCSDTVPSLTKLAVRPVVAPRSVSAHTLHPEAADLPIPSRARVYTTGEASTVRRVARPREGAGLGLGVSIGLAERGRTLTRGPSASWKNDVGGTGVGPRF